MACDWTLTQRDQQETRKYADAQRFGIRNETLSHISLLPYKHVLPNGTYFIDAGDLAQKVAVMKEQSASKP